MRGRRAAALAVVGAWSLFGARAHAQPPSDREAQRTALFEEALRMAEGGRWCEATAPLERAVAIRAAPRVLFTLGEALEKCGRTASAKAAYARSLTLARTGADDAAVAAASDALRAIDPRVPRLVLRMTEGVAGATATVDGLPAPLDGAATEVDPGPRRVQVQAAGRVPFERTVQVAPTGISELAVRLEVASRSDAAPRVPPASTSDGPTPPLRTVSIVVGGAGIATTVVGAVLFATGRSAYDDASASCRPTCSVATADEGNAARGRMIAGEVVGAVGLAMVIGGVVGFLLTGSPEVTAPSARAAGLRLGPGGLHLPLEVMP